MKLLVFTLTESPGKRTDPSIIVNGKRVRLSAKDDDDEIISDGRLLATRIVLCNRSLSVSAFVSGGHLNI